MPKKHYIITHPADFSDKSRPYTSIQEAVLYALLERKDITPWQYEQCLLRLQRIRERKQQQH